MKMKWSDSLNQIKVVRMRGNTFLYAEKLSLDHGDNIFVMNFHKFLLIILV